MQCACRFGTWPPLAEHHRWVNKGAQNPHTCMSALLLYCPQVFSLLSPAAQSMVGPLHGFIQTMARNRWEDATALLAN
jgi:hypothetical protein